MSEQDGKQRVRHFLYEGEVEAWTEDIAELGGPVQLILRDGPNDLGNDLGDYLVWLLGSGRAEPAISRCKLAKRLRIVVEDLEPDDAVAERRGADGNPVDLELAGIIKSTAATYKGSPAEQLAVMRDQWQESYRIAVQRARTAFMFAAAYELLAAQAERETRMTDVEARKRAWLIEQVAVYIATRADHTGDFDGAVRGARVSNDHEQWTFDGPLTFSGRKLEPHERENWTRYEGLSLDAEGFDQAVSMARQLANT